MTLITFRYYYNMKFNLDSLNNSPIQNQHKLFSMSKNCVFDILYKIMKLHNNNGIRRPKLNKNRTR